MIVRLQWLRQTPHATRVAVRAINTAASIPRLPKETQLPTGPDPYAYTSDRWLHRDDIQRKARHVAFDFVALCAKAVKACGDRATRVVRYEKKERGFNRVFILEMDSGRKVVAKVPFGIAGPRRLITSSEVATMEYVRQNTSLPIPKVLDWSDGHEIGTEYIIMDHAPGVSLHSRWPDLSMPERKLCAQFLVLKTETMKKLTFPAYGSIFFADAPIDSESKIKLSDRFCVGPHVGTRYWDCDAGRPRFYEERPPDRGPWHDLESYCTGLVNAGFSRIPKDDGSLTFTHTHWDSRSIQEHNRLIYISTKILAELINHPSIRYSTRPTLFYLDLHRCNIFVSEDDPTRITAIIDWQSAAIEPLFTSLPETPVMAEDSVADIPALKILEGRSPKHILYSQPTGRLPVESPEGKLARRRYKLDDSFFQPMYEALLLHWALRKRDARRIDGTLLRLFTSCANDNTARLREDLINLSNRWEELQLNGSCPYQPTPKELAEHAKTLQDFRTTQHLITSLKRNIGVDSDGRIPAEHYEVVKAEHRILFKHFVERFVEGGGTIDEATRHWPFDEGWRMILDGCFPEWDDY